MRVSSDETGRVNRRSDCMMALRLKRHREAGFVPAWKLEGLVALTLLGLFLAVVVPAYVTARKEGNSVLWASGVGLAYGFGTFGALFAVIYAIVRIIAWRESRQTLPDVPPAPEKNR